MSLHQPVKRLESGIDVFEVVADGCVAVSHRQLKKYGWTEEQIKILELLVAETSCSFLPHH